MRQTSQRQPRLENTRVASSHWTRLWASTTALAKLTCLVSPLSRAAPGQWCYPPSPSHHRFQENQDPALPLPGQLHFAVILLIAKPKKPWQHWHRLWEILTETNNIFLLFVFVSTEENHRVLSCQSLPISITGSLGLGFEGFGRGLAYIKSFSEKGISLIIWTRTTKAPEKSFFLTLLIFAIHSESKYLC